MKNSVINKTSRLYGTLFAALVLLSFGALAQNPRDNAQGVSGGQFRKVGAAGGQFLRIGVGARANGMAGAFAGVSNDLSALFYNSAGIVDIKGYAANISHTQWFGGYSHNFLAGVFPVGEKYKAGLSITSLSSGAIPLTTLEDENRLGNSYEIADMAIAGSFAAFLTEQFSFGVSMKFVQNNISSLSASGLFVDIGTLYRFGGYRAGFSISNLGSQMQFTGNNLFTKTDLITQLQYQKLDATLLSSPFNVPLTFKAGIACDVLSEWFGMYESLPDLGINTSREHRLVMAADFETLSDVPEQAAIGAEYTWNDLFCIRAGYRYNQDQFGLSGGVGVRYVGGGFDGMVDFAIQPTTDLGVVNRLSVALRFQ
jgi:hypothetical protein